MHTLNLDNVKMNEDKSKIVHHLLRSSLPLTLKIETTTDSDDLPTREQRRTIVCTQLSDREFTLFDIPNNGHIPQPEYVFSEAITLNEDYADEEMLERTYNFFMEEGVTPISIEEAFKTKDDTGLFANTPIDGIVTFRTPHASIGQTEDKRVNIRSLSEILTNRGYCSGTMINTRFLNKAAKIVNSDKEVEVVEMARRRGAEIIKRMFNENIRSCVLGNKRVIVEGISVIGSSKDDFRVLYDGLEYPPYYVREIIEPIDTLS